MTEQQLKNILTFTILLHKVHLKFERESISYIEEKYNFLIKSFNPESFSNDLFEDYKKAWKINSLTQKQLNILKYLQLMNHELKFTIENICEMTNKYLTNIEDITDVNYLHIHPKLKKFIDKVIKQRAREFNLQILTSNI